MFSPLSGSCHPKGNEEKFSLWAAGVLDFRRAGTGFDFIAFPGREFFSRRVEK